MIIRLAASSGFCFGVERAVRMAREACALGGEVCTWGELIHNPQIVKELATEGITVCSDEALAPGTTVVLRSHGIPRSEMELLQQKGCQIVDATCPYVKRAQEIVNSLKDTPVLILGDPAHPEVKGILSYGDEQTQVVQTDTDLGEQKWKTLSVVCQTTQKLENLEQLVRKLLSKTMELRVFNTICSATTQRQTAAQALAKCSDLMLVIGGKNNSNTRMLQDLCGSITRSAHIESESEVTPELLGSAKTIGLTAGASTPADLIIKVYNKIKEIYGEADVIRDVGDIPLFKEESC